MSKLDVVIASVSGMASSEDRRANCELPWPLRLCSPLATLGNPIAMTPFRETIAQGRVTVGSWLQLADLSLTEMMATAGFDWLTIDLEHTTTSLPQMGEMIRVGDLCGVPMMVRLSGHDPVQIKRALDAGARGVIAPMVNTPDEAARIVDAVYYPPRGSRGVGLSRAQTYGTGFDEYRAGPAQDMVVIAQIEHVDGVRNLEPILNVEGIDGFFVGPYDLSGSVGATR